MKFTMIREVLGPPNLLFLVIAILWLLLTIQAKDISADHRKRSTYIVHMDKSHMPEPFISHHHWYTSMVDSLKDHETEQHYSSPSILYSYNTVLHGFSATLTPAELESLKKSPGFVSARPEKTGVLETTRSPEFLSLSPSGGIWPASNFGENVIIGVVDSGIWPESESFNDHGMSADIPSKWKGKCEEGQDFNSSMCNRKLIGARYFNKGVIAANGPDLVFRMNSARDEGGHGTHTASTAAGAAVRGASYFGYATGTARGIAPRARVAAYKVSWLEGTQESDVIAGMDKAVEDGVDVLSISLGFQRTPLYRDPLAIGSFAAMERGVVVSLPAGNRGPRFATLSNGSPWAVTVAAGTMDRSFGGTVKLGNGVTIRGFSLFPVGAIIENVTLEYTKTLSACNSTELLSENRNRVIVCDVSLISNIFSDGFTRSQISHVGESRVAGAIFISNETRILESEPFVFPGVLISPKDGRKVIKYAQQRKGDQHPVVSMKFQQTFLGTKPAPTAASFSSRGPALDNRFIVKPDIMAPGTWVLGAMVPNAESARIGLHLSLPSNFDLKSGTSMACPHISGVAALLKSVHPDWSPTAIKSAMMTTANPLDNTGKPIIDNGDDFRPAEPMTMGSGNVDPNRALDPGLVYDATPQDYINFLCAMGFTGEEIMIITRVKSHNCCNSSSELNYPSFYAACPTNATVVRFSRTVTNVGDGPATYDASVKAPTGFVIRVSPKTLAFKKKNEKKSYVVTIRCGNIERFTFAELVWVEKNGNRRVRSPIQLSPN